MGSKKQNNGHKQDLKVDSGIEEAGVKIGKRRPPKIYYWRELLN